MDERVTTVARWPGHARGFTLVELMVVVAVAGVILVLAAPSMREMIEMRRLRGTTAQLVTDLQFARSEAVARRTMVRVWLQEDSERTCYTLFTAPNNEFAQRCDCLRGEGAACAPGSTELKTVSLPRTQRVTVLTPMARKAFAFDPAHGGLVAIPTDLNPFPLDGYEIDTAIDDARQLRVALTRYGRPTVCAPAGSRVGEPAC